MTLRTFVALILSALLANVGYAQPKAVEERKLFDFEDADDQSQALATIVSYEYWQRRFGGDTSVIGKAAPGSRPGTTQIIGVLAPGFELLFPPAANARDARHRTAV